MSGKTNRKHRRNKEFCEKYERSGQRELNKELKMARHKERHPTDIVKLTVVNYARKKPLRGLDAYLDAWKK